MGITCKCGRCGVTWQIMAGSPTFVDMVAKGEVCSECAEKDGGFCPVCMLKPCRRGPNCHLRSLLQDLR